MDEENMQMKRKRQMKTDKDDRRILIAGGRRAVTVSKAVERRLYYDHGPVETIPFQKWLIASIANYRV